MPLALHAVEYGVHLLVRQWVDASELRVEIGGVIGHIGQAVINLVEENSIFLGAVFNGHAAMLSEGHVPVAVERASGVDAYCKRRNLCVPVPAHREKVAHRAFDGRVFLSVPVDAQDEVAPLARRRTPDVVDTSGACNIRDLRDFAGAYHTVGIHLPAQAEVARGLPCHALFKRAAAAPAHLAAGIFRAQGPGLRVGKQGQVAHAVGYAVKSHEYFSFPVSRRRRRSAVCFHSHDTTGRRGCQQTMVREKQFVYVAENQARALAKTLQF